MAYHSPGLKIQQAITWTDVEQDLPVHMASLGHNKLKYLDVFVLCGVVVISPIHYTDVIMTTIASQITSLMVVYSTVYSDADQSKHQSSASLAFVWGIHRDRWIPRTKGQLRGKCFYLMTSSCYNGFMQSIHKHFLELLVES